MNTPVPPAAWRQMLLLWKLRAMLARGALGRGGASLPALAGLVTLAVASVLTCRGAWLLFTHESVTSDPPLTMFLLLLVGFLTSTLWAMWPVVTATVDDAAEIARFASFPIAPERLFIASLVASLVEPRALPLWGALAGSSAAMVSQGAAWPVAVAATVGLALCSAAWGRAGLHALLDVLRSRRSAEAMGAGLLLLLFAAAFVPPPDLSWLRGLTGGAPQVDSRLLAGATFLFTLVPTGGWAWALHNSAANAPLGAIAFIVSLGMATVLGTAVAWLLLARFHRHAGRALPRAGSPASSARAFGTTSVFLVLVEREIRDVLLNPRVRVMAALPFFLTILLKLVGARALAEVALGSQADAWLMGGVAAYGALVLGGGLSQNAFGYDGHGATLLLAAPVPPSLLLRAKNVVHAGCAVLLSLTLVAFYTLLIGRPAGWAIVAACAAAPWQALWLVSVGNVLSVLLPVRFSPSLKKRDRPPPASVATGLVAAAIAVMPGSLLLRSFAPHAPPWPALLALGLCVPLAFWLRGASEKLAMRLLATRRAALLRALTRP